MVLLLRAGKLKKGQFCRPLSDLDGGPNICISQVLPSAQNSRGFRTQNKKPRGVVAQGTLGVSVAYLVLAQKCVGVKDEGRRVDRACPEVQAAFLELMVLGKVCGEGHSRTGTARQGSAVWGVTCMESSGPVAHASAALQLEEPGCAPSSLRSTL